MTYKKSEIDGKPRIHEVYESEDCDGCKKFTKEETRIETSNKFLQHIDELFDRKLGQYESNSEKIKNHSKLFSWILLIMSIYGATLVYVIIKILIVQQQLMEHIKK